MLKESTLLSYLEDNGWQHAKSKRPICVSVLHENPRRLVKTEFPAHAAKHDERGVYLRWFACQGGDGKARLERVGDKGRSCTCPDCEHIHLEIKIRTKAGGMTSRYDLCTPADLSTIQNARGAPKRHNISKNNLPEPYRFNQEKFRRGQWGGFSRISMLSSCKLVSPVGINENAKVLPAIALEPGEEVWFHFDCTSPMNATYDIITDGDVFYPINRRSHRISDNLKPKSSIDLTELSILDQEMIIKAIEEYAKEVSNVR